VVAQRSRSTSVRSGRRRWLTAAAVVGSLYVGTAIVSLFMEFDNFDHGPRTGDEITLLVLGVGCVCGFTTAALWRERDFPRLGLLVATAIPLGAVLAANFMLTRYETEVVPGQSAPDSALRPLYLAPWVVAAAPTVAATLAGRRGKPQLLVVATSVTAIGWLIVFANIRIHYG
jgi:uncharacterized membrane protein